VARENSTLNPALEGEIQSLRADLEKAKLSHKVTELSEQQNQASNTEEMKNEFNYFYPVDLRTSGKDLVQNHLTFYLFHHVAIWENQDYWPKGIGVNGFVNVSGTKMSKSLGNIIPLKNLVEDVGADIVRANIVASNEEMDDGDWRDENVSSYESRLQNLKSSSTASPIKEPLSIERGKQ